MCSEKLRIRIPVNFEAKIGGKLLGKAAPKARDRERFLEAVVGARTGETA